MLTKNFSVNVLQADRLEDTLSTLKKNEVDLILVNRKLDIDYTDGLLIIEELKRNPNYQSIPSMLVTNFPEHQEQAVAAGAEKGFGKLELSSKATLDHLAQYLPPLKE